MEPTNLPDSLSSSPSSASAGLDFPVVGIGASAGGLHAFQEVLTHLPNDTGMAFVLIPHLDPTHESMMVPILSKSTRMPVVQVTEGLGVESNHVYVIPPNATMVLEGGVLRLVPRSKVKHECIDYFMISLANELAGKAIGVVLSGTASDGTEGCTAIKAEGGLTFAQDEASAKFPQMPRNAVAAGCIDVVLPPRRIAEELALVSRHPYLAAPKVSGDKAPAEPPVSNHQIMTKLFRLLRSTTGVDFAHYKQATIRRRLERRMALRKSQNVNEYFLFLEENPSEVRALHDEVLINVTSFFRDPETFEVLKEKVFPLMVQNPRAQDSIRIWVAGCSSGEEPYSLAMAFLEFLAEKGLTTSLQVFATDISEKAIAKARAGIYGAGIKASVSEERLRRFFSPTVGGEFQISKSIRDLVVFARQDLVKDPPFSRQDLVSCRNVLIYMDSMFQDRVITSFHYALKHSGFLLLGTSESVERFPHLFEPVDKKFKIYSKIHGKSQVRAPEDSGTQTGPPILPGLKPVKLEIEEAYDLPREADRLILETFVPPGVVVNDAGVVIQFRGDTSPYLRTPTGHPSFNVLKMAREDLFLSLETTLREAREERRRIRREGIRIQSEGKDRVISIEVLPLLGPADIDPHFVIMFEEGAPPAKAASPPGTPADPGTELSPRDRELTRLKEELAASKRYLQSVVDRLEAANEALRSANEEAVSSNEELLSTNEEIETAKEELQSGNEELNTINDELQIRNAELGLINSDWMNLIGSVNMAIAIVDKDLKFRRFTPPAEKLLNVIPSDVGRRITDFKNNLKIPDLEAPIQRVIQTLATTEEEVEDRNGRWYSMRIRPYRTLDDKIAGAVIVWVDIHAMKYAMQLLERTHALTDGIVETVRDPLLVLDSGLKVKKVNRAFREFFRVEDEQTLGRLVFDLGNREWDIPALRELLTKLRDQDEAASDLEVTQDFESIGPKTMVVSARHLKFAAPEEQLILMALEDVTELRVREQFAAASALASQTLDLDSLLNAVTQLAVRHIGDWACVHVLEEDGAIRRASLDHREPEMKKAVEEALDRYPGDLGVVVGATGVLRTGKSILTSEIRDSDLGAAARDKDQLEVLRSLRVGSTMTVPLIVRGQTIGLLSVFNSSSQHRFGPADLFLAEELALRTNLAVDNARQFRRAQEAIREREQFISIASHEFKTPLSVLRLQTSRLLSLARKKDSGLTLTDGHAEIVQMIDRQSDRLVQLVDNLLEVSSLTSGKLLQLKPEEMDLRSSVAAVVTRLMEAVGHGKVEITVRGDRPVEGRWDRMRIEQLITNLLTNSVKYGNGKPVTVTVTGEDSKALLTVEDQGIGIPPEAKSRLFRPYERFAPQSSTGLGLGLFIVRQIVEAHGGSIRVTSEVGLGTTFTVELPFSPPAADAGEGASSKGSSAGKSG